MMILETYVIGFVATAAALSLCWRLCRNNPEFSSTTRWQVIRLTIFGALVWFILLPAYLAYAFAKDPDDA